VCGYRYLQEGREGLRAGPRFWTARDEGDGGRCGFTRLSDYSRYVAEEIVKRLGCAPSMSATMGAAAVARIALVAAHFAQSSALTAALP